MKTFGNIEEGLDAYIARNPWNAPGSAPVHSGCGVAGGNPNGCPEGEGAPGMMLNQWK